jgi:hypothetical protein
MNSNDVRNAVVAVLGITVSALLALWDKVTNWARESFFPFIEKHLPSIIEHVEKAFIWIDKQAVNIRQGIKTAWNTIRQYLLKTATFFNKTSSNTWVSKTTSYIIKTLESKTVIKQVIEEELNWDNLPPDIRKSWMKSKENNFEIDYTALKDENANSLDMTN